MTSLAPQLHSRLLRRSRWGVAALGALVVLAVLATMSAGAFVTVKDRMRAHMGARLRRVAERIAVGGSDPRSLVVVDERGRVVAEVPPPHLGAGTPGVRIVTDPRFGALAVIRVPTVRGDRLVGASAQEQLRALSEILRVLVALTLTGALVAFPVGYALAGLALRPLDEALRERTEFVALASHQLRTPLSVIRTSAELARAGRGLTAGEALETILAQTHRMEELAARLSALARAETGPGGGQRQLVDLDTVVARVAADLEPAARLQGVSLVTEADRVAVPGDPSQMADMLTAVAENAVRFSPPGATVVLALRRQGSRATVEVSDRGPGIAPEDLPHVTAPFVQGRGTRGGYGLGLAIARAVAERHGGRLSVISAPGEGTTVRITLPVARSGGPPA